jgi:hypothetical protein
MKMLPSNMGGGDQLNIHPAQEFKINSVLRMCTRKLYP